MSVSVFVLDRKHRPLMPCRPARARRLLKSGRARVVKLFPFTIRLTDRLIEDSKLQPVLVKLDPGSRQTGVALVRADEKAHHHALFFVNLVHRGEYIRDALTGRSAHRRWRRGNLRHRAPRFFKAATSTFRRPKASFKVSVGVIADCFLSTTDTGMRGFAPRLIPPPSEDGGP